jgi:adenosylcobinamide-GDP ribazoletransferase
LLLAIQFFTRIPIPERLVAWVGFSPDLLRASAGHFPGVGWIVGGLCAFVLWGLLQLLPPPLASVWVAAVVSTAFGVWLTGAFHEDGLADTADGLGGLVSPARALEIMKDSRIGSYGATALVLALMAKVLLIGLVVQAGGANLAAVVLFLAHVVSRYWPLWIIRSLPYVGDSAGSKSKSMAERLGLSALALAAVWTLLAIATALGLALNLASGTLFLPLGLEQALIFRPWLLALVASVFAFLWLRRLLWRRLQGFTGDGLGAAQQLCELAFYFGFALGL